MDSEPAYFITFEDAAGGKLYNVITIHNDTPIQLVFTHPSKEVFETIISTFKFTEADETIGWKTYRNEEYGFEVRYPENWFVYDNETPPCAGGIRGFVFINKNELSDCFFADTLPADFYIYVSEIPEEPWGPLPRSTEYNTYTSYEIAGEEGVMNIRTEKSEGPRRKDTLIYVNHEGKQYVLSFPNTDFEGTHEAVYDQILSTFKFTKP